MAKTEQQRQRKLAKRKSKLLTAKKQLAQKQQQLASLSGRMQIASRGKISHCAVGAQLLGGGGMGSLLFARQSASGEVAAAIYLLDTYCLGVKSAFGVFRTKTEFLQMYEDMQEQENIQPLEPGIAKGLVEGAVEFAKALGFVPHENYRKLQPIWGDVERGQLDDRFSLGFNGKPFYIPGPYDDEATQEYVTSTLARQFPEAGYLADAAPGVMPASGSQSMRETSFSAFADEADSDATQRHSHDLSTINGQVIRRIDAAGE